MGYQGTSYPSNLRVCVTELSNARQSSSAARKGTAPDFKRKTPKAVLQVTSGNVPVDEDSTETVHEKPKRPPLGATGSHRSTKGKETTWRSNDRDKDKRPHTQKNPISD